MAESDVEEAELGKEVPEGGAGEPLEDKATIQMAMELMLMKQQNEDL
jgi:hypothetical protein